MEKELYMEEPKQQMSIQPQKFALWLFIGTIIMLFAALTSAYIVKQSDGNWLTFKLPGIFLANTVVILLSSVSLQWAYRAAKRDALDAAKIGVWITAGLGLIFMLGQYLSWAHLIDENVFFVSNYASGSFIYVFTGLHAFHLLSGLIFLVITLVSMYRYKVHSKNMLRMEMCTTYWHFLGALWLYLYLFLLLNS
jgi:cytochrome c oxidase subunit 3